MSGHDGHAQECRTGAHAARNARRRLRHHAGLLAVVRSDLRGGTRRAHRRVPPALAGGMRDAGPHRQLSPHQGAHADSRCPAPSTNTPAGASSASSTPRRWMCCSRTSTGRADCPKTLKIAAYASVHDLMVIPHGHSTPAGLHFSLAQSPIADADPGVPGEVERDQPALPCQPCHTAAWRIRAADIARPRHGSRSGKDRGAGRGLRLIVTRTFEQMMLTPHRPNCRRHLQARSGLPCRMHSRVDATGPPSSFWHAKVELRPCDVV